MSATLNLPTRLFLHSPPAGGWSRGSAPIGVSAPSWLPFLPGHPTPRCPLQGLRASDFGGQCPPAPLAAVPAFLPISWIYGRMMGGAGLRQASGRGPSLAAKPDRQRLEDHYPVLFPRAPAGRVPMPVHSPDLASAQAPC